MPCRTPAHGSHPAPTREKNTCTIGNYRRDIADIRRLSNTLIIQAFKVRAPADLLAAQASIADYVLLDNGRGSGRAFNWNLLEGFERPYFLAGGLNPRIIPEAIARLHPYALDLSSGLETAGMKDAGKIRQAVKATRSA